MQMIHSGVFRQAHLVPGIERADEADGTKLRPRAYVEVEPEMTRSLPDKLHEPLKGFRRHKGKKQPEHHPAEGIQPHKDSDTGMKHHGNTKNHRTPSAQT